MGMFDTVVTNCPKCGERNEIQTKAGDCCLDVYTIDAVPVEIARSLNGQKRFCDKCGHKYKTVWPRAVPTHVKMDIKDVEDYDDDY
jgi:Zn ribbon nucleic-acid-binding protein